MQTLTEIAKKHPTDKNDTHDYTEVYEQLLKDRNIKALLELGVKNGGSLAMWRDRFPRVNVFGIDSRKDPGIKGVTYIQQEIYEGPKGQRKYDVIIDDAIHHLKDQVEAYRLYSPRVRKGGIYVIEDVKGRNMSEIQRKIPGGTMYDLRKPGVPDNVLYVIEC